MKKIILLAFLMLSACLSMNAQVANTGSNVEFRGGNFYQNGQKLSPEQLCAVLGSQNYYDVYEPAKRHRTAGIITLAAGAGTTALGTYLLVTAAREAGTEATAMNVVNTVSGSVTGMAVGGLGITAMAVGGIMLGCANHKLRNLKPSANGAGVALSF